MRRNFFSQWVVKLWNSLPQRLWRPSVGFFKAEIDTFMISTGIRGYGKKAGNGVRRERWISHV